LKETRNSCPVPQSHNDSGPVVHPRKLGVGRSSVLLGVWFGFAFLASFAVKKNLTAKNAKDSQRTQSTSLGQGAN